MQCLTRNSIQRDTRGIVQRVQVERRFRDYQVYRPLSPRWSRSRSLVSSIYRPSRRVYESHICGSRHWSIGAGWVNTLDIVKQIETRWMIRVPSSLSLSLFLASRINHRWTRPFVSPIHQWFTWWTTGVHYWPYTESMSHPDVSRHSRCWIDAGEVQETRDLSNTGAQVR